MKMSFPETHFNVGMFGGKFLPFHKGHKYCLDVASKICNKVYLILFYNKYQHDCLKAVDEDVEKWLDLETRKEKTKEIAKQYPNVEFVFIDCSSCIFPDGTENWDAETPLVSNACGKLDAVFSSESGYDDYFKRAYPEATHIIVDEKRIVVPISATKIREMSVKEALKWIE